MKWLRLVIAIVVCQLAGVVGSLFTAPSIPTWYASLVKPSFNPPNWIFSPVWITLFLLMGISLYLIWSDKKAITVFSAQLFLNALWSFLFFGLHSPLLAFIEIILLWLAILATIVVSCRVSKPAAYLLIPYILWVSFAAVLNYSIMILN